MSGMISWHLFIQVIGQRSSKERVSVGEEESKDCKYPSLPTDETSQACQTFLCINKTGLPLWMMVEWIEVSVIIRKFER